MITISLTGARGASTYLLIIKASLRAYMELRIAGTHAT